MKRKAAVLWSGGKDCNLALFLTRQDYDVVVLVTFCSASTAFRAHPVSWMEMQAKALEIPHLLIQISEPFAENYEHQLRKLKAETGIEVLISGDISEVHGAPNWISERAANVGLDVFLPLWQAEREDVLNRLLEQNFEVILTMVKTPWLNAGHVGRIIDPDLLEEFKLSGLQNGLDLCGEQGEYHTMVLNGPGYCSPVLLNSFKIIQYEEMIHLSEIKLSLAGDPEVPALEKQKICVRCGIPFSCYTQGCWCAALPMIMPMEDLTDCFCPVCLKSAINQKVSRKQPDTA